MLKKRKQSRRKCSNLCEILVFKLDKKQKNQKQKTNYETHIEHEKL